MFSSRLCVRRRLTKVRVYLRVFHLFVWRVGSSQNLSCGFCHLWFWRWPSRRRRSLRGRWWERSGRWCWTCSSLPSRSTSSTASRTWWTSPNNLWWAEAHSVWKRPTQTLHISGKTKNNNNTPAHYAPCFVKFEQVAHSLTSVPAHAFCCGLQFEPACTREESMQPAGLVPALSEQHCVGAEETCRSSSPSDCFWLHNHQLSRSQTPRYTPHHHSSVEALGQHSN